MKLNYATKCILRKYSRRNDMIPLRIPDQVQGHDEESPPLVGSSNARQTFGVEDRASKTLVKTIISRLTVRGYDMESSPNLVRLDSSSRSILFDEDSPPRLSTHISWVQQKEHCKTGHINVETFLSSIISYSEYGRETCLEEVMSSGKLTFLSKLKLTSSISLPGTSSLLLYRLTLNGESAERIGLIVYPYNICEQQTVSKISASVVGHKIQIRVPGHCPSHTKNGETADESPLQLSRKLIQNNFGPHCMVPVLIDADLPSGVNVSAHKVGRPSLVYSQNRTCSVLHFPINGIILHTSMGL